MDTEKHTQENRLDVDVYCTNSWQWFKKKSQTKAAEWWLGTYSFFESVILPFPTDVFLALMVLATDWSRSVRLVLITTLSGVLGATALYLFITLTYGTLAEPPIAFLGLSEAVQEATSASEGYAFLFVFIGAFTPLPYTPVLLAAGLLKVPLVTVVLASLIGRLLRYSIVAIVTHIFGVAILPRLGKWAARATVIALAVIALVVIFVVKVHLGG